MLWVAGLLNGGSALAAGGGAAMAITVTHIRSHGIARMGFH